MSGYFRPSGGTATGSLNSQTVAITGADIAPVLPGMLIYFGSREIVSGPGYAIATVTRTDASNGTLTLEAPLAAAQSAQPFFVDLAQAGNATGYANLRIANIIDALIGLLGWGTSVDGTSKQLVLNKATAGAISRIGWQINATSQFRLDQRTIGGVEHFAIQSTNDGGTNWVDAITVRRTDGVVTFAASPGFAQPILLPQGTVTAPALAATGDTNTGIRFFGADTISLVTGGVDSLRVNSAQNVAIGTSSFLGRFTVSGVSVLAGTGTTGAQGLGSYTGVSTAVVNAAGTFGGGMWTDGTGAFSVQAMHFATANAYDLRLNPLGGAVVVGSTSAVLRPATDNGQTLGSASFRWSTVFAGTGTINTSDGRQKVVRGAFTDAELDAWADIAPLVYRWKESVERKGDAARQHAGYIAQDIAAAFAAHGLVAADYGLWCEDPITKTVTRVETRYEPATRRVARPTETIEIRDGQPVRIVSTIEVDEPVVDMRPVRDEAGAVLRDAEGHVITHPVPVMEAREVTVTEEVPDGTRLGLRYDQCAVFEAAWTRREMTRQAARILALEAAQAAAGA